jgi:serine/threonine-protein kinase
MATGDASSPIALPAGVPAPGDTIDGKYALIRLIGAGGMGVVFEAEHLRLKQRCAIKMLSPEMLREVDIVHRFEREARASALLKSAHVTRVTDVATTAQGVPYIVMELLSGQDLDGLLQARGAIPFPEAVDYVLQGCAAVAEAHGAGIIHRDLKPGNLFLAREEQGIVVKVLDFGISKMIEEESKLTSAGMTMGTALYMSPEQLRSAAKVDARSDIWSLGIILYELVCGEPPFVGTATQVAAAIVSEDAPDITTRCAIPPALGAIIHRALRRAPAERFASVAELVAALAPFAAPESLGRAVAAQISRRGSSRQLPLPSDPGSAPRISDSALGMAPHGVRGVSPDARTEVSTSVSHEVSTAVRHDPASRHLLIAALAVITVVATLGAVAVAVVLLRRPPSPPNAAAGSTSAVQAASSDAPPRVEPPTTRTAAGSGATAASAGAATGDATTATASTAVPATAASAARPHAAGTATAAGAGAGAGVAPGVAHSKPASSAGAPGAPPTATARPTAKPAAVVNPPFLN